MYALTEWYYDFYGSYLTITRYCSKNIRAAVKKKNELLKIHSKRNNDIEEFYYPEMQKLNNSSCFDEETYKSLKDKIKKKYKYCRMYYMPKCQIKIERVKVI